MSTMKILLFLLFASAMVVINGEECIPFSYSEDRECEVIPTTPDLFPFCSIDEETLTLYNDIKDAKFDNSVIPKTPTPFNIQFFKKNSYIDLTFITIHGSNDNYIGYYLKRKGEAEAEKVEIWNIQSGYVGDCIDFGDTIRIGPFDKDDRIAFYIRCGEDISDPDFCDPDAIICSDSSFHEECKQEDEDGIHHLSVYPYFDLTTDKLLIGFEDDYTEGTDNSYADVVLAFSLSESIEVPSFPVYGKDDDDNEIDYECYLNEPMDDIEWSSATFALYKGFSDSKMTSKIKYGWHSPTKDDFADFVRENPTFVKDKCIYLFDTQTGSIISSHGCKIGEHEVFFITSSCISIPSNVYLLFQQGERIFGPSSQCVDRCTIENDIVLEEGETLHFDNAIVFLKGNLTLQNGSTIEIQGNSTIIRVVSDGVLVVNGGNLVYHVDEGQLENLDGYNQTISTGHIEYNNGLDVHLVLPDKSDKKYEAEIEDGGVNLYLVFNIEQTTFPWWGILLICICIIVVFVGVFLVVVLKSSKLRNKLLPFR